MEYSALVHPGRSSRSSTTPALIGMACGLLATIGVWLVASPAFSSMDAHVQSPALRTNLLARGAPAPQLQGGNPTVAAPSTAAATHSRSLSSRVLRAVGVDAGSSADLISLVAIGVSLWAATITLLRPKAEAEAPVPVILPAQSLPMVQERPAQMDEVALATKAELESRKALTPMQVILDLQAGNSRFWSGTPRRPELNAIERRALIIAQAPTVCILSCADSRVPVELVFDQGLGSIFVVRVAGNILDETALGSVEFSVKYLGVKVVLVMGHEGCGAVKGAMTMSPEDLEAQPSYLRQVLERIKGNLNVPQLSRIQDSRAQDREAVITNASSQVKKLLQNQLISERVGDGSLLVAGAFYEITSGIVDFFSLDKNGLVTDI